MATAKQALVISERDYKNLLLLIDKYDTPAAEALDDEISRAKIVSEASLPDNVVAMDSLVTFIDLDTAEESTVNLVYPESANIEQMKISVLTPVGTALIGLRVGGKIDWPLPNGKIRHLQVVAVTQAEKATTQQPVH
jgi:regulator of nucleoside diphosphate kinase